ncbi:hypothetical protein EVB67_014 [Rhizobium phage RHph_TM3_3_14B]|nr:hypothetical protein EVB67_014 [Rhizobium phage RHph_TM3_3_14B]
MVNLTCEDTLLAVSKAVSPDSIYIINEVHRMHRKAVAAGAVGHAPTSALVLRRLKTLASHGLLVQSKSTNGYYGYRWEMTDAGRKHLETAT